MYDCFGIKETIQEFDARLNQLGVAAYNQFIKEEGGFVKYRFGLDEYINLCLDPYEEKFYRYIFRQAFRNNKYNSLVWTEKYEDISKRLGVSESKLRKKVVPSLIEKKLLYKEQRHHRAGFTFVLLCPETVLGRPNKPIK